MTTVKVEHASIRTATVAIKALTVNGRQVTQALFRQLREEDLVTVDGRFRGLPWGVVNYCEPGCKRRGPYGCPESHLHVVWQRGDELFRSYESEPREPTGWGNTDEWVRGWPERCARWAELLDLPQLFIAV